jgi:hypothetical protein
MILRLSMPTLAPASQGVTMLEQLTGICDPDLARSAAWCLERLTAFPTIIGDAETRLVLE